MSTGLLYAFSVIVVVALVAVLGIYLLAVAQGLKAIVSTLAEVTFGARAVERQLRAVPVNLRMVNEGLTDAATVLPGLSDAVDQRTGRRTA
jgi:uracil phosphoribosyltransferase